MHIIDSELILSIHRYEPPLWIVAGFAFPPDNSPPVVPKASGLKVASIINKKYTSIEPSVVHKFLIMRPCFTVYLRESEIFQVTRLYL
jgi:hypothetical protein